MSKASNCMIGRYVPFFLSNNNSTPQYYLYAIESPGLSKNMNPYVSLRKISERTKSKNYPTGSGNDILRLFVTEETESQKMDWRVVVVLLNLLRKYNYNYNVLIDKNGKNFPLIEFKGDTYVQKLIITGLRSLLRKSNYKLCPGRTIEIMWTANTYVVFRIKGGKNHAIFLKPEAVYEIEDMNMENPLRIDLNQFDYFADQQFELSEDWKITKELDDEIKKIEMYSFERR